jgi:hypothetical protein
MKRAASARVASSAPGPPVGSIARVSPRLKSALGSVALLVIREGRELSCKWQPNLSSRLDWARERVGEIAFLRFRDGRQWA